VPFLRSRATGAQTVTVENVVTRISGPTVGRREKLPAIRTPPRFHRDDPESHRKARSPTGCVTEQAFDWSISSGVVMIRSSPDAGQHQRGQRVVDQRLVVIGSNCFEVASVSGIGAAFPGLRTTNYPFAVSSPCSFVVHWRRLSITRALPHLKTLSSQLRQGLFAMRPGPLCVDVTAVMMFGVNRDKSIYIKGIALRPFNLLR